MKNVAEITNRSQPTNVIRRRAVAEIGFTGTPRVREDAVKAAGAARVQLGPGREDGMTKRGTLRGLTDIYAFFRTNETPIYFVSPTTYNILGLDRWVSR